MAATVCGVMVCGVMLGPGAAATPSPSLPEVQRRIDALNHRMEQATERYNAGTEQVAASEKQLSSARTAVLGQQRKLDESLRRMGGFAAASYRQGGVDPRIQILLAEDPSRFLAQASIVEHYVDGEVKALAEVQQQRSALAARQRDASGAVSRLRAMERLAETEKSSIEADLAEQSRLLASLEAEERARLAAAAVARQRAAAAERVSRGVSRGEMDAIPADVPASGRGAVAVRFALAQLGDPYVYGATGPSSWDCSGLTGAAWRAAGVSLSRTSSAQFGDGQRVSRAELRPGDLVFFYSPISHVGIYLGGGKIVHATHPGDVVSVDPLSSMPFVGAVRPG